MSYIGTYDGKIFHNPSNKFCIVIVKTADTSIPEKARDKRRYRDHLIRFTAVGYEIPMTDAVELELDGEWVNGKYGMQLQVEQWREIVPKTKEGVLSYLGSGLIKGIGEKTAAEIVAKFGTGTLDILEKHPERLLEVRGITENKLEDIRTSFAESRMLRDIMTLLAPFKLTPKTALKIYQHFGPACMDLLKKSPFELCQIPGFGFRRVDAIVRKTDNRPRDPMRIGGALHCTLDEAKGKQGHLFLERETLCKAAFKLLNEKIPLPEMRVRPEEVEKELDGMILNGSVVSMRDNIYHPAAFGTADEITVIPLLRSGIFLSVICLYPGIFSGLLPLRQPCKKGSPFLPAGLFYRLLHYINASCTYFPPCRRVCYFPTANVSSASATAFPSTNALALPTPMAPFILMISVSSINTSPGTTFLRNFALSIPAK